MSDVVLPLTICLKVLISFCVFADLNTTADQQYDALLMSNVVPMYPEFKSKCNIKYAVMHNIIGGCKENVWLWKNNNKTTLLLNIKLLQNNTDQKDMEGKLTKCSKDPLAQVKATAWKTECSCSDSGLPRRPKLQATEQSESTLSRAISETPDNVWLVVCETKRSVTFIIVQLILQKLPVVSGTKNTVFKVFGVGNQSLCFNLFAS